jgi:transposase-like protein
MSIVACVQVPCPHCLSSFRANATRLTSGQPLECPHCGQHFRVDLRRMAGVDTNHMLEHARAAQSARSERLRILRDDWTGP